VAMRELLALVPLDGIAREAIVPSGWRAARWATATLDAHRVPAAFILGRDGTAVTTVATWAKTNLAARAAGVAAAAMEYAEAYGKDRVQFRQPIRMFESLTRMGDDSLTGVAAARWMALHAAWSIDTNQPNAADAASRARVIANDVVSKATIDGVQLYGGYGFVNDFPVEKLMRDARAF